MKKNDSNSELFRKNSTQIKEMNETIGSLINDTPGGFSYIEVDQIGRSQILFLNRGVCELVGRTEEEIINVMGSNIFWGIHPNDLPLVQTAFEKLVNSLGTQKLKFRWMHSSGKYIPVIAFGRAMSKQNGNIGISIMYTDIIDENREAERQKELFELLPVSAGFFDVSEGAVRCIYINRAYWEMIGKQPYDTFFLSAMDFILKEDQEYLLKTIQKICKQNIKAECEIHILTGTGKYIPVNLTCSTVKWRSGATTLYATFVPVNETFINYREILPSAIRLMMKTAANYTYVKDRALNYVFLSDAYAKKLGYNDSDDIIGKNDYDLFDMKTADRIRMDERKLIESNAVSFDYSEEIPDKDGSLVYLKISKYALRDNTGNLMGIYALAHEDTQKKESFDQLKLMTDNIPGGLATIEISADSMRPLYLSEGVYAIVGYPAENYNLDEINLYDYMVEEDKEEMKRQIGELIEHFTPLDLIYRIIRKDGNIRWINARGTEAKRFGSKIILNVVFFDVTGQKQSEIKVGKLERQNWNRYEQELQLRRELIKDSLFSFQLNLSTREFFDFTSRADINFAISEETKLDESLKPDKALQDAILKNIYPADVEILVNSFFNEALVNAYKKGVKSFTTIYRRLMPDHAYHWVKMNTSIIEKPDDGAAIAFLYCTDIDTYQKTQLSISSILDEDIESVIYMNIKNGTGELVHSLDDINSSDTETTFDFAEKFSFYCTKIVLDEDKEAFGNFFQVKNLVDLLDTGTTDTFIYQALEKKGIRRKMVRVCYLDELKDTILITRRDITELYEEEQRQKKKLRKAVTDANKANQAKSAFLSQMSHDIRTPLNAVLAYSNKEMTDGADEQKLREYMNKINISGEYLLGIVNDVLDMSKIEQNRIILHPEPYTRDEFEKTIKNVINELSRNKEVEFVMDTSKDGYTCILVDHVRFNQIFINLLSNAVKFTPRGGRVEFILEEYRSEDKQGIIKRMIVKDNGIGMSKDFIPHAFDSFSQEYRKDVHDKGQGTGLGLTIVKELVRLMGGTITLESEINKGTTFTVELPFEKADIVTRRQEKQLSNYTAMKGMRILLVEDNAINAEIAYELLVRQGCKVDIAEHGEIACNKFEASEVGYYQIVFMDIRMPVMDGFSASKKIRQMDRADAATIPIIALTADAFDEDEKKVIKAGMNAHLIKPIIPYNLYDICCKYVK